MSVTGAVHQADLIVVNGRVLTMDDDSPVAEAVAIKDGPSSQSAALLSSKP